jgi:hypothetical protein
MSFRRDPRLETPCKVSLDTKQVVVWFENRCARYNSSKRIEEEFSKRCPK